MANQTIEGFSLLANPMKTKGTGYSADERSALHLKGLLPARTMTIEQQAQCVIEMLGCFETGFQKALYLQSIHASNATLFFYLLVHHVADVLPIAYTPAVGDVCLNFSHCWRYPQGLFLSIEDAGKIGEILENAPQRDVDMIVITDGERILGLGDLGINGMAIPAGKLGLYTAFAGVNPERTLPVTLDVGTNNPKYLNDPLYLGNPHERVRGKAYFDFVNEVFEAIYRKWPNCVIQFEDFGNINAFKLLDYHSRRHCCFSDDIQGTGAIVVAGMMSAVRVKKTALKDERVLFFGAGQAGCGSAEQLVEAIVQEGGDREKARGQMFLYDIDGLVTVHRASLPDEHRPFAKAMPEIRNLAEAVRTIRPTALVGLSTAGGAFTEEVIRAMAEINEQPIIFALSNPNSKSECSAEEAYRFSDGRALFASGSPFGPVEYQGRTLIPRQGNNAYIYPAIGLAGLLGRLRTIKPEYLLIASRTVAEMVTEEDLRQGSLYPPFEIVRTVCRNIAANIIRQAIADGNAGIAGVSDLESWVESQMYMPGY